MKCHAELVEAFIAGLPKIASSLIDPSISLTHDIIWL
jgi:hypothetical protein